MISVDCRYVVQQLNNSVNYWLIESYIKSFINTTSYR